MRLVTCAPLFLLFVAGSCPSPVPIPPPQLSAPIITNISVDPFMFQTSPGYRPAIHVQWNMAANGTLGVQEFIIFQKLPGDSSYSLLVRSIPGSVSNYFENIDDIGYPVHLNLKTVLFRILAIDSIGRASDTSSSDSVVLAWPPNPISPLESDTISNDSLVWSVGNVEAGYYTNSMMYGDSAGLVWSESQPLVPIYGAENDTERFSAKISNSILPLTSGGYSWVIRVEMLSVNAQAIAVRRLYAK